MNYSWFHISSLTVLCSERTVTSNIFQHETSTAGPLDILDRRCRLSPFVIHCQGAAAGIVAQPLGAGRVRMSCPRLFTHRLVPDSETAWDSMRQHETAWDSMRRHMSPNNTKHSRVPFLDPHTPLSRIALLRMIWSKMKKYNSSVIHTLLSAVGVLCRLLVFWCFLKGSNCIWYLKWHRSCWKQPTIFGHSKEWYCKWTRRKIWRCRKT